MTDIRKHKSDLRSFYTNPDYGLFLRICDNQDLVRDFGDYFDIWRDLCIHTYGSTWGIDDTGLAPYDYLHERTHSAPTYRIFMKSLFAYYATGKVAYTNLCYTAIILGSFPLASRDSLLAMIEKNINTLESI